MDRNKLIERWLDWFEHAGGRSPETAYQYGKNLKRLAEFLGETDLLAAELEQLEAFTGPHLHKMGLRPSSRRQAVAAIRGFFKWAHDRKLLPGDNPARILPAPKIGRPLPRMVSLENAEKLLMAPGMDDFVGVRDTAIISILIGCGCRASGIRNLNDSDLLWYREPDSPRLEQLVIRFREKGKTERLVPAPHDTALLIRAYLGHPKLDEIDRSLPQGDQVLFCNLVNCTVLAHEHRGEKRRLSSKAVLLMVARWAKVAGLPQSQQHPHALRHLYGTELAEADVGTVERMRLMGHRSANTTEIYDHMAMRKLTQIIHKSSPFQRIKSPASGLIGRLR